MGEQPPSRFVSGSVGWLSADSRVGFAPSDCGVSTLTLAEKMKPALLASTFWFGCSVGIGVWAEQEYPEPGWPGPEMVGDWDTFNEQFKKWEIAEFEYGGGVADGGSLIFEFKATDGSEFEVLVACSSWWTKEDWKKKQQPIFLLFETKAYRISKGSESEERLLLMLNEAASELEGVGRKRTIYIERLHEIVKSRALHGPHWPMGDLDLNGAPGSCVFLARQQALVHHPEACARSR